MFETFLRKLEPVHHADTAVEREAIYRFRYSVYVQELGRPIGGIDHARRMVTDADDESPSTIHLYCGSPDDMHGAVRIRHWNKGDVPPKLAEAYSMDLFPNLAGLRVGEIGRLMIRPNLRERLVLPALAAATYEQLVGEHYCDVAFLCCRPGLVAQHRKLGARPYNGRALLSPEGLEVPMVLVASDADYARSVGAITAPLIEKYFGRGKREPVATAPFEHLLTDTAAPVTLDPSEVWIEMQGDLLDDRHHTPPFLDALSEETMKRLASSGFVLDTPAGTLLTREGHVEKEMFIILDGTFEAFAGDRVLARMGKGEIFGEVAFFSESGQRSASVRAATDGKVIVLRRKFLEELGDDDPAAAQRILWNLGRIMAQRLSNSSLAGAPLSPGPSV